MAGRVIWTRNARKRLREILEYWKERNKSNEYPKKLRVAIDVTTTTLLVNPKIGSLTDINGIRKKVLRDYVIFYKENGNGILIISIWDTRQDPEKLKSRLSEK